MENKFLTLNESDNAIDYLIQSLVFLSQIEQNKIFIKWFAIAFHGAIHSFMLLTLMGIESDLVYEKLPDYRTKKVAFDPHDGRLKKFMDCYKNIKDESVIPVGNFRANEEIDSCMEELNFKLRNQFIHFLPMSWSSEPWYPASVCLPLLGVLKFCIDFEKTRLPQEDRIIAITYIESIRLLLDKHSKDFDY